MLLLFYEMSFEFSARKKYLSYILFDSLDDENLRNVQYLLSVKRANPNGYLKDLDLTPMHCAVGAGSEAYAYEVTSLCLKYGGDPNIRNSEGSTPLHIAAWWGRRSVADLLLKHGGDPFIKDADGNNGLDLALANNQTHLYSRFRVHQWMTKLCPGLKESEENDVKKHSLVESGKPTTEESWYDANEISEENGTLEKFYDQISYTDIDSELNYLEIFIPSKTFLSRISSVPSVKRSSSDVCNMLRFRSSDDSSSSTLTRSSSVQSLPSLKSEGSAKSWATEYVRGELKRLNMFYGPIVKTTKRLYVRQLKRLLKNPDEVNLNGPKDNGFNEVLSSTLGPRLPELLSKWAPIENEMIECCLVQPGRGSKERCFFTYVLLDPLITVNLPARFSNLILWEAWTTFIKAIFYVGKGKNSRPMAHLYDALKSAGTKSDKIDRIRHIWSVGAGVICVQAFHNLTEAEAYNREAAMIDALHGSPKLTNRQSGDYSGKVKYWSMKQKRRLGVLLLHRTMQIYVADQERQILPEDLKSKGKFL